MAALQASTGLSLGFLPCAVSTRRWMAPPCRTAGDHRKCLRQGPVAGRCGLRALEPDPDPPQVFLRGSGPGPGTGVLTSPSIARAVPAPQALGALSPCLTRPEKGCGGGGRGTWTAWTCLLPRNPQSAVRPQPSQLPSLSRSSLLSGGRGQGTPAANNPVRPLNELLSVSVPGQARGPGSPQDPARQEELC